MLKIKSLQRERKLYKVVFEDKSHLLVNEEDLFEYSLYKGNSLAKDTYHQLKEKEDYYLALDYALTITSKKFYTIKQIKDKLKHKEVSKENSHEIINYLKSVKVLDDDLYASEYINKKIRAGYGPLYIKRKLYELGIEQDVFIDDKVQEEMLEGMYSSGFFKASDKVAYTRKIKKKMLEQGFKSSIINQVLSNYEEESNDIESIEKAYAKLLRKAKVIDEKHLYKIKHKLLQEGYDYDLIETVMKEGINNDLY